MSKYLDIKQKLFNIPWDKDEITTHQNVCNIAKAEWNSLHDILKFEKKKGPKWII